MIFWIASFVSWMIGAASFFWSAVRLS